MNQNPYESPETDEERRQALLRKQDEDEVALYVPAAAFAGPEWLTKAESAAAKVASKQADARSADSKTEKRQTEQSAQDQAESADSENPESEESADQ